MNTYTITIEENENLSEVCIEDDATRLRYVTKPDENFGLDTQLSFFIRNFSAHASWRKKNAKV